MSVSKQPRVRREHVERVPSRSSSTVSMDHNISGSRNTVAKDAAGGATSNTASHSKTVAATAAETTVPAPNPAGERLRRFRESLEADPSAMSLSQMRNDSEMSAVRQQLQALAKATPTPQQHQHHSPNSSRRAAKDPQVSRLRQHACNRVKGRVDSWQSDGQQDAPSAEKVQQVQAPVHAPQQAAAVVVVAARFNTQLQDGAGQQSLRDMREIVSVKKNANREQAGVNISGWCCLSVWH